MDGPRPGRRGTSPEGPHGERVGDPDAEAAKDKGAAAAHAADHPGDGVGGGVGPSPVLR